MLFGNGFGFWKTIPTRRRSDTGSSAGSFRSWSSNRMIPSMRAPGIRSFIRLKQRKSVLLPHPDGPIRAVIWWRGSAVLSARSAGDDPYQRERFLVVSTGSSVGGGGAGSAGAAGGQAFGDCGCAGEVVIAGASGIGCG